MTLERKYRTKVMLLRDFLSAVSREKKKTRIMYAAVMNPVTFNKYLEKCTSQGLIQKKADVYELTEKGVETLQMCDKVIEKISELEELVKNGAGLRLNITDIIGERQSPKAGRPLTDLD